MRQEQFSAVVMYDLDCGWLCEIMQPSGEYESDGGRYGHTELGRRSALAAGVTAARNAGGRAYSVNGRRETKEHSERYAGQSKSITSERKR